MTTRRSNGDHRKRAPTGGVKTARPQKDFYDGGRVRAPYGSRFPRGYGCAAGRDFRLTTDQTTDQRGVSCRVSPLIVGRRGLEPRTYGLKVRSSTIELATRPTQATCTAHTAFAALTYERVLGAACRPVTVGRCGRRTSWG